MGEGQNLVFHFSHLIQHMTNGRMIFDNSTIGHKNALSDFLHLRIRLFRAENRKEEGSGEKITGLNRRFALLYF